MSSDSMRFKILSLFLAAVASASLKAGSWHYADGSITDGDWVLSTTSSEAGLTVSGVTTVGAGTEIDLSNVADLPQDIVAIGGSAFYDKTTITSVKLPNTLTSIGGHAFRNCTALAHVDPFLPDSLVSLGAAAFHSAPVEDDLVIANAKFTSIPAHQSYRGVFGGIKSKNVDFSMSGITAIGSYAFNSVTSIETLKLPETVQTIGEAAFMSCTGLRHVEPFLPPAVRSFDIVSFYGCPIEDDLILSSPQLTSLPGANNYRGVFQGIKSKTIDMSASKLTSVGTYCFAGNPVENVRFPETLREVGEYSFGACASLTNVAPLLPAAFTKFGYVAFYGCPIEGDLVISNANFTTTPTFDWRGMFGGSRIRSADFSSSGLTTLAQAFFSGCQSLEWVKFPAATATVGVHAFKDDTNLTEVIFQDYPTGLENSAFHGATPSNFCGRIRYPKSNAGWQERIVGDASFVDWDDVTAERKALYAERFPDGAKPRGYSTFDDRILWLVPLAGELGQVDLAVVGEPEEVGAPDPAYVTVPVEHVEDRLPLACTNSLFGATATIGYSNVCCHVEKMGDSWWEEIETLPDALSCAFDPEEGGIYRIRWQWQPVGYTLQLPAASAIGEVIESGERIGGLSGVGTYYVSNTVVTLTVVNGTGTFVRWFGDVPEGHEADNPLLLAMDRAKRVTPYFENTEWTYDGASQTLTDGNWILDATESSGKLTVTSSSKSDATICWLDLSKAVVGGERIAAIGNDVFRNHAALMSVKLPETLVSIGHHAFRNCTSLAHVTPFLPDSLASIGCSVFAGDPIEEDLTIANPDFTTIPNHPNGDWSGTFQGIRTAHVDLSASGLTQVGSYAFDACVKLASVKLPPTLRNIDECGFSYCTNLTHVTPFLPSAINNLGYLAFYNAPIEDDLTLACPNLTFLTSDLSWRGVFGGIRSKTVDMRGSGIKTVSSCAFSGCTRLETVYLPSALTQLSNYSFLSCSGLKSVFWSTNTTLTVGQNAFCYVPALTFRHCVPKGNEFWTAYLADTGKCTLTQPLTDDEKSAYREKFPGEKMAKGKLNLPPASAVQYYLPYDPNPRNGLILTVR